MRKAEGETLQLFYIRGNEQLHLPLPGRTPK